MRVLNIHEIDDVRLDTKEKPIAGDTDVVIKVKACGICGSDLSYIKIGGIFRQPGGVTPIGHEAAGEVIAVGKDVQGVSIGDRMAINPMNTPSNIGGGGPEGAFADEVLVQDACVGDSLLPIPDDVPYEVAAMTEPLAVAMHGVNRMEVKPGDKVVVFGCGPIGLGMVLWLVDRGITDVVAVDIADERLARATALGARGVINPRRDNLKQRLLDLHGEGPALYRDAVGTDAFIDAAGAPGLVSDVIRIAKRWSRLVITAAYKGEVPVDLASMLTTEMVITTAVGYPTEMNDVIAALPRVKDKVASLISHQFALGDVIQALGVAGTPAAAKVMIRMEEPA